MVWYPDREFILEIHDRVLKMFGGDKGIRRERFFDLILKGILDQMEREDDLYMKAAILLRQLIMAHIFEDANKRTAFTVTYAFLAVNGADVRRVYTVEATSKFLKTIRDYTHKEIAEWLKSGST